MNTPNHNSSDDRSFANPVTVRRYVHLHEAQLGVARLESEGIPTFILHGEIVQMNWLLSNAVGGVQLQVADVDLERAEEILSADAPLEAGEAEEVYSFTCPCCRSNNTDYVKWRQPWYYVPLGLVAALFGLPVAPTHEWMTCHACGNEWEVEEGT